MKIEPNDKPTELTYIDLLAGLQADIEADAMMPNLARHEAREHVIALQRILGPHSA